MACRRPRDGGSRGVCTVPDGDAQSEAGAPRGPLTRPPAIGRFPGYSREYPLSTAGAALSLTLLRANIHPDPLPDLGEHLVEYTLVPHGIGREVGHNMAAGVETNLPVVLGSCSLQSGELPASLSLGRCRGRVVRPVALMKRYDGNGLMERLVKVGGGGVGPAAGPAGHASGGG